MMMMEEEVLGLASILFFAVEPTKNARIAFAKKRKVPVNQPPTGNATIK